MLSEPGGRGGGVWVMADEIYERITYDTPHEAFACLPGMWERTMTASTVKQYVVYAGLSSRVVSDEITLRVQRRL